MTEAVVDRPPSAAAETRAWSRTRREELKKRYFRKPDAPRTLVAHADYVDELLRRLLLAEQARHADEVGQEPDRVVEAALDRAARVRW